MTNKERWDLYTSNLFSPQSFIDFGFYFTIAASLQRRVWFGLDGHRPIYPNLYLILVGPPAVGKGLVIGSVFNALNHHKHKDIRIKTSLGDESPPLFPIGADSTTFEALTQEISKSKRVIRYDPNDNAKFYAHTSHVFVLEELSSLLKKKSEDVVDLLIRLYDSQSYDYKTKNHGSDHIRNVCESFIAATQVGFLKDAQAKGIFGQGFSSRCIFVYETQERFTKMHLDIPTDSMLKARDEILAHILDLSKVYGQLSYKDAHTKEWLEEWYAKVHKPREEKASERMKEYFGRMKVHIPKLAAAIHFSEHTTLEIPHECFVKAIDMLDAIHPNMDACLNSSGRNELHPYKQKIKAFIKADKQVMFEHILLKFGLDLTTDEVTSILKELELTEGLKAHQTKEGNFYAFTK